MTEVGRQPWTVYDLLRTEDAVTGASGMWISFAVVLVLYTALGVATVMALRVMARRWRERADEDEGQVALRPAGGQRGTGGER